MRRRGIDAQTVGSLAARSSRRIPAGLWPEHARRMTVSPRTLQRFLEREGTTWRPEVETVRRAQAASLQRAGLSKSQVARRLGYSDVRVLRRAVKRWERCGGDYPVLELGG